MMWYYGSSSVNWLWMVVTMFGLVVFASGVFAFVVWAFRRPGPSGQPDGALDVLRRRLAAGEITPEEFEKTRKLLGA